MLKCLELLGFKSFAEKTAFTFGAGITAIVGPNGSGKSNIVDAIRWIMGEQSAKSLRGGEMTDVIFNGSSTRKSLGLAEVTLVLDNRQRRLRFESDEVQITRRVYRDGQGEYFINKQPSRLRDIKDLFLGSGAGADAYCIIAQGKVDALLQASNHDRRQVFEEAAGISRFRAKKLESQRKLEQVEQNLLRVRDIMEELQRQLQGVRLQATKAQKFQEYQQALRERFTQLTLHEYHVHQAERARLETELNQLRDTIASQQDQAEQHESLQRELERQLNQAEDEVRRTEAELAAIREQQIALESTLRYQQELIEQKQSEQANRHDRCLQLEKLLGEAQQRVATCQADYASVEARSGQCEKALGQLQMQHDELTLKLKNLRRRQQDDQARLLEVMREAARAHNECVSLKAHGQNLEQHRQRLNQRFDQANQNLSQMDLEVRALEDATHEAALQEQSARSQHQSLQQQAQTVRHTLDQLRERLLQERAQRQSLQSQIQLLEELDRTHEGLNPLAVQILDRAERNPSPPWNAVYGVLADWLEVVPEYAGLIDLLLGEKTQSILLKDQATLESILQAFADSLGGRADFILLEPLHELSACTPPTSATPASMNIDEIPGWMGPVARLVACPHPEAAGLVESLLGQVYMVQDLETALLLSQQFPSVRWATPLGEVCSQGSQITLGQVKFSSGMLARKSQLRDLQDQAELLEDRILQSEQELTLGQDQENRLADQLTQCKQTMQVYSEQLVDLRARLVQHKERSAAMSQEVHWGRKELQQLEEEWNQVQNQLELALNQSQSADAKVQALQHELEAGTAQIVHMEHQLHQLHGLLTQAKVDAATVDERRSAVAKLLQQVQQQEANHREEWNRLNQQQQEWTEQITQSHQIIADAQRSLSQSTQQYAALQQTLLEWQSQSQRWRDQRLQLQQDTQQFRTAWQEQLNQRHVLELRLHDITMQQEHLSARLREEWELDLQTAYAQYQAPEVPIDPNQLQTEIADLKKKINRLGSINLEALHELAELETRAANMQKQHDDLVQAKAALDEILEKLNGDSRRMFTQTFESVRQHFQDIFRKLFGGGLADIVLENPDDVLESGIEIVARPPGKESRQLSLLSGGEKSLAAVALLLAIFRDKPSPFCIMDEVDAALDEANVGRFVAVLREFLDLSQFIIISHSKKTMAAADVLYGVTMQEAGVSKRIAVRLEDADTTTAPSPSVAA